MRILFWVASLFSVYTYPPFDIALASASIISSGLVPCSAIMSFMVVSDCVCCTLGAEVFNWSLLHEAMVKTAAIAAACISFFVSITYDLLVKEKAVFTHTK